jgi:hypothetical protein
MGSVLQGWVEDLSWKKQSVLIGAVRAPDVLSTLNVKKITVWIRAVSLRDADPMTGFMHGALRDGLPLFEQIDREWERLPLHVAHHLLLAIQVIANEHPELPLRVEALSFYNAAVDAQHLNAEGRAQYEQRYADNPDRIRESLS